MTDHEILERAGAYVGAPYRLGGRTPAEWDCWGCLAWGRRQLFGKDSPCAGSIIGPLDRASAARIAEATGVLVAQSLKAWRAVDVSPGVALVLTVFNRPAHVALALPEGKMLHAMVGSATIIERIDAPRWQGRLVGAFDA